MPLFLVGFSNLVTCVLGCYLDIMIVNVNVSFQLRTLKTMWGLIQHESGICLFVLELCACLSIILPRLCA